MWEPRRLTTIWASTACYRGSFTFAFYLSVREQGLEGVVNEYRNYYYGILLKHGDTAYFAKYRGQIWLDENLERNQAQLVPNTGLL
jgi:hypothetical protein